MKNIKVGPGSTILLLALSMQAQSEPVSEEKVLRAVSQGIRTCTGVTEVQQGGSQFRLIMGGNVRTEFDLADMFIASNWSDRVYLRCNAPGCVSQFVASGGQWVAGSPENTISLSCPGAEKRITAQLAYFYENSRNKNVDVEERVEDSENSWKEIGSVKSSFGPSIVEIDQSSIQEDTPSGTPSDLPYEQPKGNKAAWIRISFPPYHARGKSMSSSAMHVIFNCDIRQVKVDGMIAYEGPRGTGEELESSLDNERALWAKVPSRTPQELAFKVLCGRTNRVIE